MMKKMSLFLTVCLFLSLISGSIVSFADDIPDPWKVGDSYYPTLKAAVAALAGDSATVYLCRDLTETVRIDSSYVLSDGAALSDGMALTIEGAEKADGSRYGIRTATGAALIVSYVSLTVKNLELEATGKLSTEEEGYGTVVLGESAYVAFDHCSIRCGDGTYTAFRTRNNTGVYAKAEDVDLTLTDTEINGKVGNGITSEGFIGLTVNSGTVITSVYGNGIYCNGGGALITINGGSVTGGGVAGAWKYGIYGGDSTRIIIHDGYVQGTDCAIHGKQLDVTVNGGAFKATNASRYGVLNSNNANTVYKVIAGSFEGAAAVCMIANEVKIAYPDGTNKTTITAVSCTHESVSPATCTERAKCTVCGAEIGELDPDNHTVAPVWSITESKHSRSYPCCGKTDIEETDHTWDASYTTDTEPTCTATGSESVHCTVCQAKKPGSERELPATGHSASDWATVTPATCTKEGTEQTHCTVCNTILETRILPKTEHQPGEWIVDAEAQVGVTGHRHKSCTACHAVIASEEIPALVKPGGCKGSLSASLALLCSTALLPAIGIPHRKKQTESDRKD